MTKQTERNRATYSQLWDENQMLHTLNGKLQSETAQLRSELERLKAQLSSPLPELPAQHEPRPGWWIITPSPYYTGTMLGIEFTRGQAFIPAIDGALERALVFADELGYAILYTPDYTGPLTRPDVARRPPVYPPQRTERDELREMFRGYR